MSDDPAGYGLVAVTADPWINERARRYLGGLRPLPPVPEHLRHPGHSPQSVHAGKRKGVYTSGGDLLAKGDVEQLARDIDAAAAKKGGGDGVARFQTTTRRWGPDGDEQLVAIAAKQGFTGKPLLVDKKGLDQLVKSGHVELHRGARMTEGSEKSAAQVHSQFRNGKYFAGLGHFGNGTYAGPDRQRSVDFYSDGSKGSMLRMAARPDAKIETYAKVFDQHEKWLSKQPKGSIQHRVFSDVGRYAAARGIDIIHIPRGGFNDEYIILNRTAVAAQKAS